MAKKEVADELAGAIMMVGAARQVLMENPYLAAALLDAADRRLLHVQTTIDARFSRRILDCREVLLASYGRLRSFIIEKLMHREPVKPVRGEAAIEAVDKDLEMLHSDLLKLYSDYLVRG
jgi:hypothetical protein